MAKVTFIILSAIVACVFAEYPLPYPSHVPSTPVYYPPPVPKPQIVYGAPKPPPIPSTVYGVPEVIKRPPVYVIPQVPKQPSFTYGVPHHHHQIHHGVHDIPKKFVRTPVVSHYKYEIPQQQPVFQPFKADVPQFYYPKPASVYGLPHF